MNLGKTLYVTNRNDWRSWLAKNHAKEKEIWLIYYRKSSSKPRIPYNDAVEEALCYGWIDSIVKLIDEKKFAQRFTPRRPKSMLSEMNKERIRRLIKKKKMTPVGLKAISKVFDKSKDKEDRFTIAPDILKALKADMQAWKNFKNFPEGYKKVRIGYIESQRRHGNGMFQKSLQHFIRMTAKNKKFGMVQ
ncbi:MAG: YdeI/OmpD-associated family protein [Candidatus Aenigmarchaeota archaeon]|nr:YdeI/OmpD-associated family protein [Candidatus Aenigmarchaeota archaeon]